MPFVNPVTRMGPAWLIPIQVGAPALENHHGYFDLRSEHSRSGAELLRHSGAASGIPTRAVGVVLFEVDDAAPAAGVQVFRKR